MKKQFECIPIEDYYVVVDNNSTINKGCRYWVSGENGKGYVINSNYLRYGWSVIATIGKRIEGIPLIDIPEEDAANIFARQQLKGKVLDNPQRYKDLYDGYKAAQSKGTYTEEDMINFGLFIKGLYNKQGMFMDTKNLLNNWKSPQKKKVIKAVALEMKEQWQVMTDEWTDCTPDDAYDYDETGNAVRLITPLLITNTETNTITPVKIIT